jgi:hypothetical protein
MIWAEAAAFPMSFGQYKGEKLDVVAKTDEGLRYLDWVRGEVWQWPKRQDLAQALDVYLDDPCIRSELEEIL